MRRGRSGAPQAAAAAAAAAAEGQLTAGGGGRRPVRPLSAPTGIGPRHSDQRQWLDRWHQTAVTAGTEPEVCGETVRDRELII